VRTTRPNQPLLVFLLVALALTIGGATLSSAASGAPVISGPSANGAAQMLLRPALIRAEIVTFNAGVVGDYWVYRGVVRKIRGHQLTLAERDGSIVQVELTPTTQIAVDYRRGAAKRIRPGMRVTVMRIGNAAASWLYVAGRRDESGFKIRSLLTNGFVRAEVISWAGGAVLDSRVYTGVVVAANNSSLTLQETDGTTVQLQIDSATQVRVNNAPSGAASLVAGMKATAVSNGSGVAAQIWAQDKKPRGRRR